VRVVVYLCYGRLKMIFQVQGRSFLAIGVGTNPRAFNLTAQRPKIFYRVFKRSRTKFNSKLGVSNAID